MSFKNIFISVVFLVIPLFMHAQDNTGDPQVLIGSNITNISGFGGFLTEFSAIDKKLGVSTGGGGAVLLNQIFYMGGYGIGHNSETSYENLLGQDTEARLDFGHGGFWFGYIFKPTKLIHYNVSTKLGWGSVGMYPSSGPQERIFNDNVFVLLPQAEAEINIAYWFRINGALGFRLVTGVDNSYYTGGDFNSPTFTLSFLFGWFKKY